MAFNHLILQCRAGFEKEAAAEITDKAADVGEYGYCKLEKDTGYVQFITQQPNGALNVVNQLRFRDLIFIRQWTAATACVSLMPDDRIGQLQETLEDYPLCHEVWIEHPDTTDGRELGTFARKFSSALAQSLRKTGKLVKKASENPMRLQIFALTGQDMFIGVAPRRNAASTPMGIHRLKFPKDAPSRSTLKLEEAWHWFIPKHLWDERIPMSGTGVDLGAAPGGWTWQLVNRSMFVTAVDNGPMAESLMESGQVKHATEDAYQFVPQKRVDMMVCDVVEKPIRTAQLAADWILKGYCRETIFNLKLPMKQRYQASLECFDLIHEHLTEAGVKYQLGAKHLYHDREEITCSLRLV